MTLTPAEIVCELDRHIVGQPAAKRAVAIALRNRWRRMQVAEPLRGEITPKNILMSGPTGVGKTEIARRLARLANAPFIKVEATKFTEVGYVGREVDSIIKDLMDVAMKLAREEEQAKVQARAKAAADERVLDSLLPRPRAAEHQPGLEESPRDDAARTRMRQMLADGALDEREIDIEVKVSMANVEIMSAPGMEQMSEQLQGLFHSMGQTRTRAKRMRVRDAMKVLLEEEAGKLINEEQLHARALTNAEQNGIVFIDEIDKIVKSSGASGADISREGVQRDLLPLVEGCTVSTRYGAVRTDHILFIASGAFHVSKPSDLIPELQGRFPIRVSLDSLDVRDFVRILTEPAANLVCQYQALLATEGLNVEFAPAAIERLAQIALHVNENTENIGARRLYAVMERLLGEVSFTATDRRDQTFRVDAAYVEQILGELSKNEDLSRFIL